MMQLAFKISIPPRLLVVLALVAFTGVLLS